MISNRHRPGLHLLAVTALACGGTTAVSNGATARAWYLDGLHGKQSNSGSSAAPFRFIWQALQKVKPGDTIYVVPSMTYPQLGFTANGTASAPITLAGADASRRTKVSGGGVNSGIWINGNHVVVRGFDVTAPGPYVAVSIAPHHHHVTIANNTIHDAGANGINTISNDYITISHNLVYGNAKNTTLAFGSGISLLGSVDIDRNTGVKMIVDGNIVYGNTNVPNCSTSYCFAHAWDSDGSGIILDDNQRQRWNGPAYKGAFLVSNNVIYRNGGRGVHVFRSDNATITGNTIWFNNQDHRGSFWHPGEVSGKESGNIKVYNNILESDGGQGVNPSGTDPNTHVSVSFEKSVDGRGPIIVRHNLGYNPQNDVSRFAFFQNNSNPVVVGSNWFAGPKLENPAHGDFRFRPGSPADRSGDAATSVATDLLGVSRSPRPSVGAYQKPGP